MKNWSLFFLLFSCFCNAQSNEKACETISKIRKLINYQHYQTKAVDDSLSTYVFKTFMLSIDEDAKLFTREEFNEISKHKFQIDDYINDRNCNFLDEIYELHVNATNRNERIINEVISTPIAYEINDSIFFSRTNFPNPVDETEMKYRINKIFLFNVLKDVAEQSTNKDSLSTHFNSIAPKSVEKISETYKCKAKALYLTKSEFYALFYNAFCTYFDPHTNYLSQSDRQSFMRSLSSDDKSFGMYVSLNENEDAIVVDAVIPGSDAYKTKKINTGDVIQKIIYNNNEYKIGCSSLNKIEEIFFDSNYKKATFVIRKKTGAIYNITLSKKIVKNYETMVYSYIIKKDSLKIGYIKIPSFYSTYENGATNVSEDVIKELYKLKSDTIDGLILDLENNGGGSMSEATRLTGMFIDIGPMAILNNSVGQKEVIKDYTRGTVYNGPIVVLINGFSASASEFFTNTLQDYNRAIIVGNKSQGKATMQRIFPLEDKKNPDEFVKITVEQFFRITGKSNQNDGIIPHVEIPTLFDKQMPRESIQSTAFKNSTIDYKLNFNTENNTYTQAIEKSLERLKKYAWSSTISSLNEKINKLYDDDLPPTKLNFNSVFKDVFQMNTFWKELTKFSETEYELTVENNSLDKEYDILDEFLISNRTEKIKSIKTNFHIFEAVNIIQDLKN